MSFEIELIAHLPHHRRPEVCPSYNFYEQKSEESRHPDGRRSGSVPERLHRLFDRNLHAQGAEGGDHLLRERLHGPAPGQESQGDVRRAQELEGARRTWRQPHRQQPREAHEREGLREARPRQGRTRPAESGGRPVDQATAWMSCTPSAATTPIPPPPSSRNFSSRTATISRSSACPSDDR